MAIADLRREITRHLNATDEEINRLIRNIIETLSPHIKDIKRSIDLGETTAIEVGAALSGLQESLSTLGLQSELERIENLFGDELEFIQAKFKDLAGEDFPLTEIDVDNLRALVSDQIDKVSINIQQYVGDIKTLLIQGSFLGEIPNFDDLNNSLTDTLSNHIKTELNTAIAGYQRLINQQKAEELGLELFLYVGPDDKVIRPFCAARVGRAFTQAEINSWDNEQGIPANVFLGGWNCRHHLRPITEARAKELGAI